MSKTYDLVCPETKRAVWVGQGNHVYSSPERLRALAKWLHEHEGKAIFFVAEGDERLSDVEDKDWVGMDPWS